MEPHYLIPEWTSEIFISKSYVGATEKLTSMGLFILRNS